MSATDYAENLAIRRERGRKTRELKSKLEKLTTDCMKGRIEGSNCPIREIYGLKIGIEKEFNTTLTDVNYGFSSLIKNRCIKTECSGYTPDISVSA